MIEENVEVNYSTAKFIDYDVYCGSLDDIDIKRKTLINTINQYSYCIAEADLVFKNSLQKSDILLPDGIAIVAAVKMLSGVEIKKIAGDDIHYHLLNELNSKRGSCFYLGSSIHTLEKISKRVSIEYPDIHLGFYSPPYKPLFSDADNQQMIDAVNNFKPDVLFVGMTAPKQEKWAYENRHKLDTKIICSIGAVFDFFAGTVGRPSKFWINIGLEWFIRLIKEPKRMSKRYLWYGPIFVKLMLKQKFKK